jgi:hypothetical protein
MLANMQVACRVSETVWLANAHLGGASARVSATSGGFRQRHSKVRRRSAFHRTRRKHLQTSPDAFRPRESDELYETLGLV